MSSGRDNREKRKLSYQEYKHEKQYKSQKEENKTSSDPKLRFATSSSQPVPPQDFNLTYSLSPSTATAKHLAAQSRKNSKLHS